MEQIKAGVWVESLQTSWCNIYIPYLTCVAQKKKKKTQGYLEIIYYSCCILCPCWISKVTKFNTVTLEFYLFFHLYCLSLFWIHLAFKVNILFHYLALLFSVHISLRLAILLLMEIKLTGKQNKWFDFLLSGICSENVIWKLWFKFLSHGWMYAVIL